MHDIISSPRDQPGSVAGYPKDQATWSRVMGYVEQMDIHSPTVTVGESLMFSARMRLPGSCTDAQVSPCQWQCNTAVAGNLEV